MLTALVIAESPAARSQVTGLLELAGWGVHEAADGQDARWLTTATSPDLIVTTADVPGVESAAALLRELRAAGSTAHFVVVTPEPTDAQRAAAAAAGALACLAAPIDAHLLLDLVRSRTAPAARPTPAQDMVDVEDLHDADLDADLMERLQEMYDQALPNRFSAIDRSVRAGDPRAVADAAHTLAGTSGQLGHPDVAGICRAIAADARRGILAHSLVSRLAGLAGVDRRGTDRRGAVRAAPDRRVGMTDRRASLAFAADAMSGAMDLGGLVHAVDASAGRLAARRRGLAA